MLFDSKMCCHLKQIFISTDAVARWKVSNLNVAEHDFRNLKKLSLETV
jgi:hypothetical protein